MTDIPRETMCEYWKRRNAMEMENSNVHWMPVDKPKYVLGVPYPIEDIDKKNESLLNDPSGCW